MNKEVKEKTGVGVSDDNAIVEGTSRGESENRGRGQVTTYGLGEQQ